MFNRSQIMKTAWNLFRKGSLYVSFAQALRFAWMLARGSSHCYEISTPKGREYGYFTSFEGADNARRVRMWDLVAEGVKPFGTTVITLARHF